MRQVQTAVLERDTTFDSDFATEPYEVAWAGEARFFIHTLATSGQDTEVRLVTQISPDGLTWCDLDGKEHVINGPICSRSCSISSGVASEPRMSRAGSPGTNRSTRNTMVTAPHSTNAANSERRMRYAVMAGPLAVGGLPVSASTGNSR